MDSNWDILKDQIHAKIDRLKEETANDIEQAKNNEILKVMQRIDTTLTSFDRRLAALEGPNDDGE